MTNKKASPTNPGTWRSFDEALATSIGVGYVFTADDGLVGIDLDRCHDPETGTVESWAKKIVEAFGTYTEVTPSGTGLHLISYGSIPSKRRRAGRIEMYDNERYFTMTGAVLPGYEQLRDVQDALGDLYAATFPEPTVPLAPLPTTTLTLDDREVIERASSARNGAKFQWLMAGDGSDYRHDDGRLDPSGTDLGLCSALAFWTQDKEQIDRIFRQCGLYRKKWERQDYRDDTIRKALHRDAFYQPRMALTPASSPPLATKPTNGTTPAAPPADTTKGNSSTVAAAPYTDLWNAELLAREHGADLRWCEAFGSWFSWDGTRWMRDESGEVMRRAKNAIKSL